MSTEQYYEYLIDTYQNLVFTVCIKIVKDYFDAEDLAQETFLSAYQHLPTFNRQYEKAWLCRIATNKCLDFIKKSSRNTIPTEETFFIMQETNEPSPEENILDTEVKQQLYAQCNKLKKPYREVAIDYFYRELVATEIAQKTGRNLKTVQTQIYRAKTMLQKKYKKEAD
ncbi:RNA polymerase sigma factor [Mobilitalea sibirica]|uniref:RNA polymerase sigma factor n=1 Tax=Mobilitalea sibirica TaxID=1462919 RepID=A0A8J7GXL9_9FIRM|nr:RNA polymerase sigma factor [Mobilitalea sibirica]